MSDLQTLIDMGFAETKAMKALEVSGKSVEQAMEWLLAHADDPEPGGAEGQAQATAGTPLVLGARSEPEGEEAAKDDDAPSDATDQSANSLKCDDCGKLFRNNEEVQFHAAKSGHSNFSESTEEKKALTEEEKAAKLKEIEEKLKQRRALKENEEKEEQRQREKKRIQMSKEITETKRKFQEDEMKRIAEERRREKLEDKKARQKVLDQIAKDREVRKQKANGETPQTATEVSKPTATASAPVQPTVKKTYDSARLQIRLPSGAPLVQEFKAKEPLNVVRLWVSLNRQDGVGSEVPFTMATTFPRKVFSDEDMDKPLDLLGLVPSSVLIINNK